MTITTLYCIIITSTKVVSIDYYYDAESGLYYLINRYYDPELGRFISCDHIGYMAEQTDSINGCNLYAYCLNNPVMGVDPEGTFFWFILIGAIVGFATSFTSSAVSQAITNNGKVDWGVAVVDGLFGAASGAIGAIPGVGTFAGALIDGGLSAVNSLVTTGMQNGWNLEPVDWGIAAISGGMSAGISLFSGIDKVGMKKTAAWKSAKNLSETLGTGKFLRMPGQTIKSVVKSTSKSIINAVLDAYATKQAILNYALGFVRSLIISMFM